MAIKLKSYVESAVTEANQMRAEGEAIDDKTKKAALDLAVRAFKKIGVEMTEGTIAASDVLAAFEKAAQN